MSGSPVFIISNSFLGKDGPNIMCPVTVKLLGVLSGQPIVKNEKNKEVKHTLSIIWNTTTIKHLINIAQKQNNP
jgi:hypothetical protein